LVTINIRGIEYIVQNGLIHESKLKEIGIARSSFLLMMDELNINVIFFQNLSTMMLINRDDVYNDRALLLLSPEDYIKHIIGKDGARIKSLLGYMQSNCKNAPKSITVREGDAIIKK